MEDLKYPIPVEKLGTTLVDPHWFPCNFPKMNTMKTPKIHVKTALSEIKNM